MTQMRAERAAAEKPTRQRPGRAARRFGYVIAVVVNGVLLLAVNVWPGWETVPFLTSDTRQVLGLVNASIVWSVLANLAYLVNDRPRVKAVGDALGTTVGVAAMLRVWQVFPFDFGDSSFDWALLLRVLLVVGIVGSMIGIVVNVVAFLRSGPRA